MIRILLVDDQNLVQQGIKSLLEQEPEIKVIGTVKDGRSAVMQINDLRPDVVLLDIEMPGMDGITATKYITHLAPQTKVIILSSHEDKKYLTRALMAGAKAYILKSSLTADLKQSIMAVNNGYSHIESRLLAKIFDPSNLKKRDPTPTKAQLKQSLDLGKPRKQIAEVNRQTVVQEASSTKKQPLIFPDQGNLADAVVLNQVAETTEVKPPKPEIQPESNQIPLLKSDQRVPKINLSHSPSRSEEDFSSDSNSNVVVEIEGSANTTNTLLPAFPPNIASNSTSQLSTSQLSTAQNQQDKSLMVALNSTDHRQRVKKQPKIVKYKTELAQFWAAKKLQYEPVVRRFISQCQSRFIHYKAKLLPLLKKWHKKGWLANAGLGFLGLITMIIIHRMFF